MKKTLGVLAAAAAITALGSTPAMAGGVCDAAHLQPGQRIVTRPGVVETVVGRTTIDRYGNYKVYTDKSTILTPSPCPVKLVN